MNNSCLKAFIKLCLCLSTVYAPVSSYAEPKLSTSGGGGKPPIYPPTTYSDGLGPSDNDKRPGDGTGKPLFVQQPKPFGTIWGVDSETRGQIYFEGLSNYQNRVFLWKYKDASMKEVIRGSTPASPNMKGWETVTWEAQGEPTSNFKIRLLQSRVNTASLPEFQYSSNTGSSKRAGEVAKTATATTPEYLFMGERDSQGRERVWAYRGAGQVNEGYLSPEGQVLGVKPYLAPKTTSINGGKTSPVDSGKKVSQGPAPKSGKFAEVWGMDTQGRKIYYEGSSYRGKLFVWRYTDALMKQVERGSVETDPAKPGYQQSIWDRGNETASSFKSKMILAGVKIESLPQEGSRSGSVHRSGELALAATAAEPAYHYSGERNAEGQEKVWAFMEKENRYVEGYLNAGGKVLGLETLSTTGKADVANQLSAEDLKWRPSQLEKTMSWTADKGRAFKSAFMNYVDGVHNNTYGAARTPEENLANMEKLGDSKGVQLGLGIAAFYTAMGAVAAYELLLEYPNNPMVMEQYFAKFDAQHVMMLGGFMAVAYPFMRKMPGFSTRGNVIRSLPMFAAGLFAGAAGTVVMSMAADSDVRACNSVGDFVKTGQWHTNVEACDRAFQRWNTETLRLQLIPKLESMMVTGAIFLGAYYVVSEQAMVSALRMIPVLKGAKPGALGVIMLVVGGVIWMGADKIANSVFNVEQFFTERQIADESLEDNLFKRWEVLRKNNWIENKPEPSNLPKCQVLARAGTWPRPCDQRPNYVDFATTLDKYSSMMSQFRNAQLANTYGSYNAWSSKVLSYHAQLGAAYEVYSLLIQQLANEQTIPGLSENDARGFNYVTVRNLERQHINGTVLKGDPGASGWERSLGLDKDRVVTSDPVYTQDFSGTWKYVETSNFFDYAVTSMACGPETEGQSENSIVQNISQFMSEWVTGNTAPSNIIGDPAGQAMVFHPPRITRPRPGTNRSVCEMAAFRDPVLDRVLTVPSARPENFLVLAPWFSGLKDYKNLYGFIKDNVRESVLANGKSSFDSWWTNSVTVPAARQEVLLRQEYEKMLKDNYVPALSSANYYWCEERDTKGLGFYPYWAKLAPVGPSDCGPTRLHRLGRGLVNSLRDEYRLYMAMILDLYASNASNETIYESNVPHRTKKDPMGFRISQATAQAKAALDAYDQYLFRAVDVAGQRRQDADLARDVAELRLKEFRDNLLRVEDGTVYSYQQEWMKMLFTKVDPIITQTKTFYSVLKAFEPPTLDELAAGAVAQK